MKSSTVAAANDGDNTLVAAIADRSIIVLGYSFRFVGAGAFTVKSGAAGTSHLVEVGVAAPGTRVSYAGSEDAPAWRGDKGAALVVNNFATGDTFGHISYIVVGRS